MGTVSHLPLFCYYLNTMGIVELSLVPGAEEECLIHTDALPVNLKCRCLCLGLCSEEIVNILMWPS